MLEFAHVGVPNALHTLEVDAVKMESRLPVRATAGLGSRLVSILFLAILPAAAYGQSVKLAWDPTPDTDIAGYNVYRSEQRGVFPPYPINGATLVAVTSYTDETIQKPGIYYYAATAVNTWGGESGYSQDIRVVVGGLPLTNRPPVVSAGPNQTITFPGLAVFRATASDDGMPNGALTYRWSVVDGTGVVLRSPESSTTQAYFFASGTYTIRVTVSDGNLSSTDELIVTAQRPLSTGHLQIKPPPLSASAFGFAVVEYRQDGELVSEVALPASPLIRSGRIYTAMTDSINTGVAFSNPGEVAVTLDFFFTDASGVRLHAGTTSLSAKTNISVFLSEVPFAPPAGTDLTTSRTFTFTASLPIGFTALQTRNNERSEFLMTAAPAADLESAGVVPVTVPFYVQEGGWNAEIQLVNPADSSISGRIESFPQLVNPGTQANLAYQIAPRSAITLSMQGMPGRGWIHVTPTAGMVAPAAAVVMSFRSGDVTVSRIAIPASKAVSGMNLYAESNEAIQTLLAVCNPAAVPAHVSLELFSPDGSPLGVRGALTVDANNRIIAALEDVPGLEDLALPFRGFIRLTGSPVVLIGFKGNPGDQSDFPVKPVPPVFEPVNSERMFVYFVDGGGFRTQVTILGPGEAILP
jgi:hypothetical protein